MDEQTQTEPLTRCEFCGTLVPTVEVGWIRLTSPDVQAICSDCDER